jgi:hypothetical protein
MIWAALLPLLKAAAVGAAVGGGTSAVAGGDWKKGALMGAAGGGLTGGFSSLLGGGAGAASGGAAGAGSGAAGAAGKATFSQLLKDAAIKSGTSAVSNGLVGAAMPSYGMTSPGNVPQMQSEDPMVALEQLMKKSKRSTF